MRRFCIDHIHNAVSINDDPVHDFIDTKNGWFHLGIKALSRAVLMKEVEIVKNSLCETCNHTEKPPTYKEKEMSEDQLIKSIIDNYDMLHLCGKEPIDHRTFDVPVQLVHWDHKGEIVRDLSSYRDVCLVLVPPPRKDAHLVLEPYGNRKEHNGYPIPPPVNCRRFIYYFK